MSVVHLGKLSGYVGYSYMVGNVWFPVTGGLFLGDDAGDAVSQNTRGIFPIRRTSATRCAPAFNISFCRASGLPPGRSMGRGCRLSIREVKRMLWRNMVPQVVSRVNFARGRVRPALAVNSSLSIDVYRSEKINARFQVDGDNLNNRLNVLDFGGLFSGNAIAPGRSVISRLNIAF